MNGFRKIVPWLNKAILLMCTAIFVLISLEPLAHPAATAATQGIAFTSSLGATIFRVSFAGFLLVVRHFSSTAFSLLGERSLASSSRP